MNGIEQMAGICYSKQDLAKQVRLMTALGGGMRLDKFDRLVGSVAPGAISNLLTDKITDALVEMYHKWPDTWRLWIETDSSDYLDTQYREIVSQLTMIPALEDTGGRFIEIEIPDAARVSYNINGFGGIVTADFQSVRSDRLKYFSDLGKRLGRAAVARLHEYIYITQLRDNPTLDADDNSLFDSTNHANDFDSSSAGKELTYANARSVMRLVDELVDNNNQPIGPEKIVLIVGTYNREMADQLMGDEFQPGTANRNKNMLRPRIAGVAYSKKLQYDWYIAPALDEGEVSLLLTFFEGKEEPEVTTEAAGSSYQFENKGKQRYRVDHWYGGEHGHWSVARGSTNNEPS